MEKHFDPNIPDESDDGYFCKFCLIHANSENMWAVHIAGKRHIKNVMKYSNGLPSRQNDDNDYDSFEKPAKYGRYENDEWNECSTDDYENRYYTHRNYTPEIKPEVLDYGHKKCLPDVISSPVSKTLNAITGKVKHEDPIDKIFADEKFDQLKKSFEEQMSKTRAGGMQKNAWNSNKGKPRKEESPFEDGFEKELDELLKNSPGNPDYDKDAFSNEKFKRKIDDLFSCQLSKRETRDKEIPTIVDCVKDSHKRSNKTEIPNDSISVKKRDDKDKMKLDRNSYKKKSKNNNDEEDFVDIFHKMNDQKLFGISAVDESEDNSSVKKSFRTNSKLDEFDPDELTPDVVDNLLSSYLKPKADSSKSNESAECCTKNSAEINTKEDDIDSFARKLEFLPTKTFFEIILARLKKVDLKDSDELKMLLGVISQAQEVVCKKLPPHLQAVIKSKLSQDNSKTTPVPVQYPKRPQINSVSTTQSIVSQTVSQPVLPTTSWSSLKSNPQSLSQKKVRSVSEPVSHMSSQTVQTPVSKTAPSTKSRLSNSDSFQSMIAWQKYLTSMGEASEKHPLKSSNSVQATIAYQNYLSSLQAKAVEASKSLSKTTPKNTSDNTGSLNFCSKSKASLSSPNSTQATTVSVSAQEISTSKSVNAKDTLKNFLSTLQATVSKAASQTPSSSLTKSALPCTSALKNCKKVSQTNGQIVSSTAEIPTSNASFLNQAALQNYQTYYQQMHALHLQRMSGPYANVGSLPSASLATFSQNLAVSQPNSLPSYSWYNSGK